VNGAEAFMTAGREWTPLPEPPPQSSESVSALYLHSAQLVVASEPTEITTILGSCVAVCVWDATARVGGMNHFMLPFEAGAQSSPARYAKSATATLLVDVAIAGASLARLQAKIFGGACMMAAFRAAANDLGTQNVEAARRILASAGVPIVAEDVGGTYGRKLIFRTDTGVAMVKKISGP
jgi:chemotaxis protein CheD